VEKNYILAERAVKYIDDNRIKLITVSGIPNSELPFYYNAADVLILTSLWEGSPNVIKEAMACNCPIVSTDVGDVRSILGETEGTYLTSFDYRDVAEKLSAAIKFTETSGRTKGRERIMEKGLDSGSVSEKLINIYISVIKSKEKLKQ
jgi:teichuronic acid biosynthesis glycosyltransferase TuaC